MTRWPLAAVFIFVATCVDAGDTRFSSQIDTRVNAALKAAEVVPAPRAGDAEFLRRVSLDLTGRIPAASEAREFLDDATPGKRAKLVDRLLASPRYTANAARLWRGVLVPQATSNPRTQQLGVSVEVWARTRLRAGLTDGKLVRELLTARLDYLEWTPDRKPDMAPGLSPVGFYQANDLKPETVGSAVARTFLGLKLECALCHDHPFDKWTQTQAWETAAFFAGVAPPEQVSTATPGLASRRKLPVNGTDTIAAAKFLDGQTPDWGHQPDPRAAFADWLTRPSNPYFAKVMANRVWADLFGVGLVNPIDDWGDHNPPSNPELLELLATAYRESGFDAKVLVRAIVMSDTYQRTSRQTDPIQTDPRLLARMNVKGLSAEQLYESLTLATGHRESSPSSADAAFGWPARSPRGLFIAKFGGGVGRTDMQVSILQALYLVNGEFLTQETNPATGATIKAVAAAPFLTDAGRIETLFLATLTRRPTAAESARYLQHLSEADDKAKALGDVLWVLLNSQEFLVNH